MDLRSDLLLRSLVVAGLVFLARGAGAALITASGQVFTGVDITLTMATETGTDTTTLSYEISLGTDATAAWQIAGFTVIREWGEGAFHSTASATGWSVTAFDDFVNWKAHTAGSEISEGTTRAGFTYTYFGDPPAGQFYRYLVSQDGATPFQLISTDVTVLPPAVIPEPASAALLALPLATLFYRRRGRSATR